MKRKQISLNIVKEVWLNDTVFHKVLSFLSQKFLIIWLAIYQTLSTV